MSSSNFGPSEDARNSSRVLKPPGGGHTDIFGFYEHPKPTPQKSHQPKSSMCDVFGTNDYEKKTDKTDNIEKEEKKDENGEKENGQKENGQKENGQQENGDKENGEKENGEKHNGTEAPPKPIPATPQRVRVPPGGFSSGLW